MNESELEEELRELRPRAPSCRMEEQIARALEQAPPLLNGSARMNNGAASATAGVLRKPRTDGSPWWRALGWAGAGAVAALLLSATFRVPESTSPPLAHVDPLPLIDDEFEASDATADLIEAEEIGVVYDEEQTPQRQFRLTFLERHTWTNPVTGAVLEYELPREDIVMMPVAMQ